MNATAPELLRCPACSSPLRSEDLDLGHGIAKCGACQALMTIPGPAPGAASAGGFQPRPPVPLPPRVRVDRSGSAVEIRRRWFTPAVLFMVAFCMFWDGFLVVWYGVALTRGAPLLMSLFPLIHVAVGVGITYATLAAVLNTTTIRIQQGTLSIAHGPIPWRGNWTVPRGAIDQLWCKDVVRRGKHGPVHSYEVWIRLKAGTESKLVGAGLTPEQALFLEQQIESALGVRDRAVAGEMPR